MPGAVLSDHDWNQCHGELQWDLVQSLGHLRPLECARFVGLVARHGRLFRSKSINP